MIPRQIENDGLTLDFEEVVQPSRTYKLNIERNRIVGYTDEREAMKQAIFLMLNIERYQHIIFSWNYGVELMDLFGMPMSYVASEAPRRIRECLLQDDRINEVDSFEVTTKKNKVHFRFTARTIFGDIDGERKLEF